MILLRNKALQWGIRQSYNSSDKFPYIFGGKEKYFNDFKENPLITERFFPP